MIIAHHLICTAYGWWLANDPRGSTPLEIRVESLSALGPLHYGRKTVQPPSRVIREFYDEAGDLLKHQLLTFDHKAIDVLADAIGKWLIDNTYTCYACALMPDHVHLLIRRHRDTAEIMLEKFQAATRNALIEAGHRAITHPDWGGKGWKVFQNSVEQVWRTVEYIELNPVKVRRPRQRWAFVKKYDGWMPRIPR